MYVATYSFHGFDFAVFMNDAYCKIYPNEHFPNKMAWAVRATNKDTQQEALDELEFRIDGRPSRLVAAGNFFSVRPKEALTQANLAEYFFKVLDSGITAGMKFDIIAIKFLQHVPHGHKTFTEWETRINSELDEVRGDEHL